MKNGIVVIGDRRHSFRVSQDEEIGKADAYLYAYEQSSRNPGVVVTSFYDDIHIVNFKACRRI